MADRKEKIGVAVRVPEWVLDEIEEAIRMRPRPRPTRGELLEAAWLKFKAQSIAKNDESVIADTDSASPHGEEYNDGPSTAGEMLTALIISGRKDEVSAILRLIRSMFETVKGKGRIDALVKTGHGDFDRAAAAIVRDAKELRDGAKDIPSERRKGAKRSA